VASNGSSPDDLPVVETVDDLADLVRRAGTDLYVRWSKGPADDRDSQSRDDLTGIELPGLSASALAVEDWWRDRSLALWIARRLYDYRHLRERRDARAWLFRGVEVGRGPDNEPLVRCEEPLSWIGEAAVAEAEQMMERQAGEWGTLDRGSDT
jgi:hypothetical protein